MTEVVFHCTAQSANKGADHICPQIYAKESRLGQNQVAVQDVLAIEQDVVPTTPKGSEAVTRGKIDTLFAVYSSD